MGESSSQGHGPDQGHRDPAARAARQGPHGQTAPGPVSSPPGESPDDRKKRGRSPFAGLIGALVVTVLSLVFVSSFIGALHDPGPRSAPLGIVGPPATASMLGSTLNHAAPGG